MKHNDIQIIGIPEREQKEQGVETLLEKIITEKIFEPGEGQKNTHTSSGSTEDPYQDEPQKAYSKTHS